MQLTITSHQAAIGANRGRGRRLRCLGFVLAVLDVGSVCPKALVAAEPELTVRVYNYARVSPVSLVAAKREAGKILGTKMNRYNGLKLQVLSLFSQSDWLAPNEAAVDFFPARSDRKSVV